MMFTGKMFQSLIASSSSTEIANSFDMMWWTSKARCNGVYRYSHC